MAGSRLWQGSARQKLRLASGLVLLAFAATHFLNHALGLVSLETMLAVEGWRIAVTRSLPGSLILLAALLAHAILGLEQTIRRKTLRLPTAEWLQIATGLAIPVLLIPHVVNTRGAAALFGVTDSYLYELARIWPSAIVPQSILLLLVWVHGCIGLHYWLRTSPRYAVVRPVLFAIAVLIPFAALAGVSVQGRAVEAVLASPDQGAALRHSTHWPAPSAEDRLTDLKDGMRGAYVALLGLLALIGGAAVLWRGRSRRIPVRYVGGPLVRTEPGPTLLEISRRHGIPHVSVCGGRGRCSTCRVLVLSDADSLSPIQDAERKTLRAIGAGAHIRLACQASPVADATVLPLVKTAAVAANEPMPQPTAAGVERELAVLFVDLRGFTALTESKLPFDVIYILNQFFATVGQPIYDLGGWIANYAGDGVIALFSDDRGIGAACRAALLATVEIDRAMTALNARLAADMHRPLEIAMGLHAGPHVVGRIGFGQSQTMSVVGLAVNVASRLETLAKSAQAQLALSGIVADHGLLDIGGLRVEPIEVRGLREPLDVILVKAARDLVTRIDQRGAGDRRAGNLDRAAFP